MKKIIFYFILLLLFTSCLNKESNREKALELHNEAVEVMCLSPFDVTLPKAIELLDSAISLAPDMEILYQTKMQAYMRMGEYGKAMQCAEKVTFLKPELAEAWTVKGILFRINQDTASSNYCLEKAISLYNKRIRSGSHVETNLINKWCIYYILSGNRYIAIDSLNYEASVFKLNNEEVTVGINIINNIDLNSLAEMLD